MTCCQLKRLLIDINPVSSSQQPLLTGIFDPAPCTASDEEIKKAQAIREALRRKLLGGVEPQFIARWVVGAD